MCDDCLYINKVCLLSKTRNHWLVLVILDLNMGPLHRGAQSFVRMAHIKHVSTVLYIGEHKVLLGWHKHVSTKQINKWFQDPTQLFHFRRHYLQGSCYWILLDHGGVQRIVCLESSVKILEEGWTLHRPGDYKKMHTHWNVCCRRCKEESLEIIKVHHQSIYIIVSYYNIIS